MAAEFSAEIEGAKELQAALEDLPAQVAIRTIGAALRDIGKIIAAEVKRTAPKHTGLLVESIAGVNVRKGVVKVSFKPVKTKKGKMTTRPGRIAHFHEFGTSKMAKKSFMRPAVREKGPEAIAMFSTALRKQIKRSTRRLKKVR